MAIRPAALKHLGVIHPSGSVDRPAVAQDLALWREMTAPREVVLTPHLVTRSTTAPPGR